MTDLNKQKILKLLDPNYQDVSVEREKTTYQSFGPNGQLDKHLAILSGDPNCFRSRSSVKPFLKKRKLIFSNGFFKSQAPTKFELELFSILTEEYEIYLWSEDADKNLSLCKPCETSEEFWKQKNSEAFRGATKEKVIDSLRQQGIPDADLQDMVILDFTDYCHFIKESKKCISTDVLTIYHLDDFPDIQSDTLDVCERAISEDILNSIPLAQINKIKTKAPVQKDIDYLTDISRFQNLEEIALDEYTAENWGVEATTEIPPRLSLKGNYLFLRKGVQILQLPWNRRSYRLEGRGVWGVSSISKPGLINRIESLEFDLDCSWMDLTICQKLKELKVNASRLEQLSLPMIATLERLELNDLQSKNFELPNLSQFKQLKTLKLEYIINGERDLKTIERSLVELSNLEEFYLRLPCDKPMQLDFKKCEKLKKIELSCPVLQVKSLNLNANINLEECILSSMFNLEFLEIDQCNRLKKLVIFGAGLKTLSLRKMHQLEVLSIKDTNISSLNLGECLNLKDLIISGCSLDENFNLAIRQLEKLTLTDCKTQQVDFSQCKRLKSLTLENMSLAEFNISLLDNLEELTLEECSIEDLSRLNLGNCKKLKRLAINCRKLINFNLSNLTNLEELYIANTPKKCKFDFTGCKSLRHITMGDNNQSFPDDISQLPSLERSEGVAIENRLLPHSALRFLSLDEDNLKNLDHLNYPNLEELQLSRCRHLTELDFKQLPNLKRLKINNCKELKQIDLSKLTKLEFLEIHGVDIEKLDLSFCKNLKHLEVSYCPILSLDVTPCSQLESFVSENEDEMHEKNFKLSGLSYLKKVDIRSEVSLAVDLKHTISLASLSVSGKKINLNVAKNHALQNLKVRAAFADIVNLDHCEKLKCADLDVPNPTRLIASITAEDCLIKAEDEIQESMETTPTELKEPEKKSKVKSIPDRSIVQQNNHNPVSCFSDALLSDDDVVDDDTAQSFAPYKATGNFKMLLETKTPIRRTDQRIRILDSVKLTDSDEKVNFYSQLNEDSLFEIEKKICSFDVKDFHAIRNQVKQNGNLATGYFLGEKFEKNKLYPIPTHQAMSQDQSFDLYCNPPDSIELYWHPNHQQYYFKLKAGAPAQKIEFLYIYKKSTIYDGKPDGSLHIQDAKTLLPEKLITALREEFKTLESKDKLFFLIDPDKSIQEKIDLLRDYCENFENIALTGKAVSGIQKLWQCALQQKGSCRHRSEVFMILARYLGIPVRMIGCEKHRYCEIPYQTTKGVEWQRAQLGGSPTIDVTDQETRTIDYQKMPAPKVKKKAMPVLETKEEKKRTPEEEKFYRHIKRIIQKREIADIRQLLKEPGPLAPLIELSSNQDPFLISKKIVSHLAEEKSFNSHTGYVFINNPEDFDQYLKPYQLKNGERQRIRGPLDKMIDCTDGTGGVLIVNWSNFTLAQITTYKSILDELPLLSGKKLRENVYVIGLIKPETRVSSAFTSRCQRCILTPEFFKVRTLPVSLEEKSSIVETIDLFGRLDWKDYLFGKIFFNEDKIELGEGVLLRAIKQKCPLHIINPPEDKDFALLLKRIEAEGKVFFNGEFIPVPKTVNITTSSLEHKMTSPHIRLHYEGKELKSEDSFDDSRAIYLGLHNLHECFQKLIVSKDKKAKEFDFGFFKENTYFYLTENITRADWQLIVDTIEKICDGLPSPQPIYHFKLAPGVKIKEGPENDAKPVLLTSSTTILTNDPDYFCQEHLKKEFKEKPLLVNVTPQMRFDQLFAKLTWNPKITDTTKVEFNFEEKALLTELRAGRKIILKGDISPDLYKLLLAMLSSHPYLNVNGERLALKPGQVVAVMPASAKRNLSLIHYAEFDYNLDHYLHAFPGDQEKVKGIHEFFNWARRLPISGLGRPRDLSYSYERLSRMIHDLKYSPLHKHNPIKGNFLYDHPKGTEDYAYLNVIGKLLFHRDNEKPEVRLEKLTPLLKDPIRNLWRILNCFNGTALFEIFGKHWREAFLCEQGMPSLSKDAMEIFQNKIITKYRYAEKEQKYHPHPSHLDKRAKQLATLLEDKATPLIILKGPPGVGKTFTSEKLKEIYACYEGEGSIAKWREDASDKIKILFLNETNMKDPGFWDYLKNLNPSPQHKIVMTVNPETYNGRQYHKFFQHFGETIYYKMPEREFLEKLCLEPALKPHKLEKYSKSLLDAYELIQKWNSRFSFSYRDLENLAKRFVLLRKEQSPLLLACIEEFSHTIRDPKLRQAFLLELTEKLQVDDLKDALPEMLVLEVPIRKPTSDEKKFGIKTKPIYIPKSKIPIVHLLEHNLLLRGEVLKNKNTGFYKQGIMFEGDPGLGKSTLYEAILIKYNQDHSHAPINYYVISAGDENAHETIKKAHREGAIVILDELNADPTLEPLICELLTTASPGFMIFTSQNINETSEAIRSRFQWIYMDPDTRETYTSIASCKFFSAAPAFVKAWEACQAEQPKDVNSRTFYTALHEPVNPAPAA